MKATPNRYYYFSTPVQCNQSKWADLAKKIFWEFDPYKTEPTILPKPYRLAREWNPRIYIQQITEQVDLQKYLVHKAFILIDKTLNESKLKGIQLDACFQNKARHISDTLNELARQIEHDLSRHPEFRTVRGAQFKEIIEKIFYWRENVLNWLSEKEQAELKAKLMKPALTRKVSSYQEGGQSTPQQCHEQSNQSKAYWTGSVSNATAKLPQAVEDANVKNESSHNSATTTKVSSHHEDGQSAPQQCHEKSNQSKAYWTASVSDAAAKLRQEVEANEKNEGSRNSLSK